VPVSVQVSGEPELRTGSRARLRYVRQTLSNTGAAPWRPRLRSGAARPEVRPGATHQFGRQITPRPDKIPFELTEVQVGSYTCEYDIKRVKDVYGRSS